MVAVEVSSRNVPGQLSSKNVPGQLSSRYVRGQLSLRYAQVQLSSRSVLGQLWQLTLRLRPLTSDVVQQVSKSEMRLEMAIVRRQQQKI